MSTKVLYQGDWRDALGFASASAFSRASTTVTSISNSYNNLEPDTMAALLPDDLLHMICHQLWEQRDFDTLYHCARAGKQLAVPALASIYRYKLLLKTRTSMLMYCSMHNVAPVTSAYNDEIEMAPQERTSRAAYEKGREQLIGKWASMWRSLILSSLGKTLFPYSKYVRTLSLQDLEYLLQDARFLGKTSGMFFKDGLEKFEVNRNVQISSKKSGLRIDAETTANRLLEGKAIKSSR